MQRSFIFAGLLLVSLNAWANCSGQLLSANFSLAVQPDAMLDANTIKQSTLAGQSTLYFQSVTRQPTDDIITHHWTSSFGATHTIKLRAGQGEWQAWSAVSLPDGQQSWQVEVTNSDQCVLGRFHLKILDDDMLLQQARDAIDNHQLLEAKLLLKDGIANSRTLAERHRREAFFAHDLMLAEAEADIANQQFVAARGRLQSLAGKLPAALEQQRLLLLDTLKQAQSLADNRARLELDATLRLFVLAGLSCPAHLAQAQSLFETHAANLPVTLIRFALQEQNKGWPLAEVTGILPSGKTHTTRWPCLPGADQWRVYWPEMQLSGVLKTPWFVSH